jgi:hypothetical protein
LSGIHGLNGDELATDRQVVHLLDCYLGILGAVELDKGEALALAGLGVSMDVDVVDFAEGVEYFFELVLLDLGETTI